MLVPRLAVVGAVASLCHVAAELPKATPDSGDCGPRAASWVSLWQVEHGPVKQASPEMARDFYRASDRWAEACPSDVSVLMARFDAVRQLPELSDEVVLAEAERTVGAWEAFMGDAPVFGSPHFRVAELLLERNLEVERVPGLVARAVRPFETTDPRIELSDERHQLKYRLSVAMLRIGGARLTASAYLALADRRQSEVELGRMDEQIRALEEEFGDDPHLAELIASRRSEFRLLRARLDAEPARR